MIVYEGHIWCNIGCVIISERYLSRQGGDFHTKMGKGGNIIIIPAFVMCSYPTQYSSPAHYIQSVSSHI